MRYFDLKFGYSVKGKSVTCFLLPHFNGDKVRLNKEFANCLGTERFGLMLVVLTDLNRLCDIHPMSLVQLCWPRPGSPNPIHPMQIRDTLRSELPSFV